MIAADGVAMLEIEDDGPLGRTSLCPTLLWDAETAVLIDTGMPGHMPKLRAAMLEAGVPPERLTALILTHQDLDHIGSAPEVVQAAPDTLRVYAHPLDKPYIEGELPLIKTTPAAMAPLLSKLNMPEEARQKLLALCENPPATRVNNALEDGQLLPYCGGIRVIHTPGHTEGHVSLYHEKSRTLIAADALACAGGILRGPFAHNTLNMEAALQSLHKLLPYEIERVICYHGGLCTDGAQTQLLELTVTSATAGSEGIQA
ncbi:MULTISPECIES: MBL fold metallo-hydrolase [Paenibacillus]|uniref:MBL fold metallo-hydrolase n=1 Tax=Paenibacillus TaxID=44249 RepID=UPI0022B91669|nr:MBL fold metallo-hydrolase [Paenibacillus caseinilyticus]MCZ8522152.1 MBL fold metallo-hydrolase [Paenibacillus caseinilyticus]